VHFADEIDAKSCGSYKPPLLPRVCGPKRLAHESARLRAVTGSESSHARELYWDAHREPLASLRRASVPGVARNPSEPPSGCPSWPTITPALFIPHAASP